jgi:uroporphyrin-III C-methyltransferase/precorrin-2 dehydrogenase/sirohydrochlorin ferrochelatase
VTLATLADLPDLAVRGGARSPALLIVGEVAGLGAGLAWFGANPRRWEPRRHAA